MTPGTAPDATPGAARGEVGTAPGEAGAAPGEAGARAAAGGHGGGPSRRSAAGRIVLDVAPTLCALLAEGAWIAVLYALPQARQGPMLFGPLAFTLAAAAGLLAARFGSEALGDRWPATAVALVALFAAAGWLAAGETRAALASSRPLGAITEHAGGWLLGLAFLRGLPLARDAADDRPTGSLVAVGVPAVVVAFVLGSVLTEPARTVFRDAAFPATVLFIAAGLVGLTLARIRWLDAIAGLDWRRNRAWLGLLLALVAAILLVAVPASFAIGPLVLTALAALPATLLVAGLFGGIDRRVLRILLVLLGFALLWALLRAFFSSGQGLPQFGGLFNSDASSSAPEQVWLNVGWFVLLVAVVVLIALLAAAWMREVSPGPDSGLDEERSIDYGDEERRAGGERRLFGLRRRRPRAPDPRDAPEAYLAAVAALATHDGLRRWPGETPAEHARRVRATAPLASPGETRRHGPPPVPLSDALTRLAADYELARFGGRELTAREHRRGLARWESIRRALRSLPARVERSVEAASSADRLR